MDIEQRPNWSVPGIKSSFQSKEYLIHPSRIERPECTIVSIVLSVSDCKVEPYEGRFAPVKQPGWQTVMLHEEKPAGEVICLRAPRVAGRSTCLEPRRYTVFIWTSICGSVNARHKLPIFDVVSTPPYWPITEAFEDSIHYAEEVSYGLKRIHSSA